LADAIRNRSKEIGIKDISIDGFDEVPKVKANFAKLKAVLSGLDQSTKDVMNRGGVKLGDMSFYGKSNIWLDVNSSEDELKKHISGYSDAVKLYNEVNDSIALLGGKTGLKQLSLDDFSDAAVVKANFGRIESILASMDKATKDTLIGKDIKLGDGFYHGRLTMTLDATASDEDIQKHIRDHIDLIKS